jgi:hypothetical protein
MKLFALVSYRSLKEHHLHTLMKIPIPNQLMKNSPTVPRGCSLPFEFHSAAIVLQL